MTPGDCRFRPVNKLTKSAQYQSLFASGKRTGNRLFLFIFKRNSLPEARLGLAVSKKNVPLAVRRNRLKRIIRDSFRRHKEELAGMDIVVLVKRQINTVSDEEISNKLEKHWKNVKP